MFLFMQPAFQTELEAYVSMALKQGNFKRGGPVVISRKKKWGGGGGV